jgi:predicted enzyme related to lactoylglutathione lyase
VEFYRKLLDRAVTFDMAPYTVIAAGQRPVSAAFQQIDSRTSRTPVHIDLHAVDLEAACARVEELGGRLGDRHTGVGSLWRQAFDPDGNVLCLLSRPDLVSPAVDPV